MSDERDVRGHKVFVSERDGGAHVEMVNDDRPLVRMGLTLLATEALDLALALLDAAHATPEQRLLATGLTWDYVTPTFFEVGADRRDDA